ncbi:MAG: UDP-N-acetylmuramate--L-alanine ligase [Clostridiales bacterium]|jgi:UDP-N-acetylmuramate--alanine ligase|nr:UDP-N-acetylmuramate--L-alanine ligase [Clostridiales bacterium]
MNCVHFIGIGGVSMSGLAEILHNKGMKVSGSDMKASDTTRHLEDLGIHISIGHNSENIHAGLDLVVYTAAVKSDNPELAKAKALRLGIMDRAELLGKLMEEFSCPICISGTHGKTSTTSMVTEVLLAAQMDPTVSVGGHLDSINGNFRMGKSGYFVVESCEYCDSFLKFYPKIAVILNVDRDHLDYFSSLEQIEDSFASFARNVKDEGTLVICSQIPSMKKIVDGLSCSIVTYGSQDSDIQAKDVAYDEQGCPTFRIVAFGKDIGAVSLKVRGSHNILNSLAAAGAALASGAPEEAVIAGLSRFGGAKRRFEIKGSFSGVMVVDDYAHHPAEIAATLAAASKMDHGRIWCVFQPHTYTRTLALMEEFSESFGDADKVLVLDIYAAREKDAGAVHASQLTERLREKGKDAIYFSSFGDAQSYLKENCIPRDLLITMGAGDVYLVGENLVS